MPYYEPEMFKNEKYYVYHMAQDQIFINASFKC